MADESLDPLAAARALRTEVGQRLTPAFAKTYSQYVLLRTGQDGLRNWQEKDFSDRLKDAAALVEAGFICREGGDESWQDALRRAGELLEWLSHPSINRDSLPLGFLGAACYQLAGYPARSAGLINQHPEPTDEGAVLRDLLRGDFPAVLSQSLALVAIGENENEEQEKSTLEERQRLAFVEFARGLAVIAAGLRWGDEPRLQVAVDKLNRAQAALAPFLDPYTWLLLRLCAESAASAVTSSLRMQLSQLEELTTETGSVVLDRYARSSYLGGRSLSWPSQIRGYNRLARGGSFALCAPTGSGKTAVAEIALLLGLFEQETPGIVSWDSEAKVPLCLYIVPTRALAAEVEAKLSTVLRSAGGTRAVTVTGLYGGTDWGPADVWLTKEEPTVLICTQEKAEALVRFFGHAFLRRLRLVIVDEAHEIQEQRDLSGSDGLESRALRLESLIGRLRTSLESQGTRFIAISAVAEEIERPLARWISGDTDDEPVRSHYRSTRQLIGRLICTQRKMRIEYDRLDGSPLEFESEAGEGPYVPNAFPPYPPLTNDMSGSLKGTAPYALWAAMQLAGIRNTDETPQSVLISLVQHRANFMRWFLQLLDEDWAEQDLPDFFEEPVSGVNQGLWQDAKAMCIDYFGEESWEYRLLQYGIVVHHGKMPGRLPGVLVRLVERKIVRIVVATSTLSQGVNLPFETVLIPTLLRHPSVITGREFGNLIGRAGRPGTATEGQALVLLQAGATKAAADYRRVISEFGASASGTGAAQSALAQLVELLRNAFSSEEELVAWLETTAPVEIPDGEASDQVEILDELDGILLANIEEANRGSELSDAAAIEDVLKDAWKQTFAHYASSEEERLGDLYLRRGRALFTEIYAEQENRRRYYKASLPPRDASKLFELMPRAIDCLASGADFHDWDFRSRFEYVEGIVNLVAEMPRFALPSTVGKGKAMTPWREILEWWLVPDAESQPSAKQVADWHSFIAKYFGYRFNWALGALVALITNESDDSEGGMLSPEDWGETGLPWVVVWIKEMTTWGTLEPVAAYLLARGVVVTRKEANQMAQDYYSFRSENSDESALLDPATVRDWASSKVPPKAKKPKRRPPDEIDVELKREFEGSNLNRTWRVLPVQRDGQLRWTDPAGYVLAGSKPPPKWRKGFSRSYDFFLEPDKKIVISEPFL